MVQYDHISETLGSISVEKRRGGNTFELCCFVPDTNNHQPTWVELSNGFDGPVLKPTSALMNAMRHGAPPGQC